ncbi:MAG: HAD family acid phosphatase [Bdellovibrionia bacterium]
MLRFLLSVAFFLGACAQPALKHSETRQTWPSRGPSAEFPTPTPPTPLTAPWMKWVSIEELSKSLPQEKIAVGFDIDDTVLFSSPGSFYGLKNQDGKNKTNKYGDNPHRQNQFFNDWTDIHDAYSMPKYVAQKLITLHSQRGDDIYFITARPYTGKKEKLTERLKNFFNLKQINPVVFNGFEKPKSQALKELDLKIYYGDADSDIKEAQQVGVRPIRVLRAVNSNDSREVNYGMFGEEIIPESDR